MIINDVILQVEALTIKWKSKFKKENQKICVMWPGPKTNIFKKRFPKPDYKWSMSYNDR